jgi:methylated-DNA-[protein]-cysteine S-methyltransferase
LNIETKVYKKLLEVPPGKVVTYGELARAVHLKNGQRAIGRMMKNNPYPGVVPCHRVVLSSGKVGGYAYGQKIKINMLKKEGIKIQDYNNRKDNAKIINFKDKLHRF